MAKPALYEQTIALNPSEHAQLRVAVSAAPYAFAADMNVMPVSYSEFNDACHHYPIVFMEGQPGHFHPVVLLGLEPQRNLYVAPSGNWSLDEYIPAFARRYPFMLGTAADQQTLALHVDANYAGLSESEGNALYDNGEESKYFQNMMAFVRTYQEEIAASEQFGTRLHELGLLQPQSVTITRDGKDQNLAGFSVVDREAYQQLADEQVLELFKNGALALIERHLSSLGNVHRLGRQADRLRADN